jgi:hypothetical protein
MSLRILAILKENIMGSEVAVVLSDWHGFGCISALLVEKGLMVCRADSRADLVAKADRLRAALLVVDERTVLGGESRLLSILHDHGVRAPLVFLRTHDKPVEATASASQALIS